MSKVVGQIKSKYPVRLTINNYWHFRVTFNTQQYFFSCQPYITARVLFDEIRKTVGLKSLRLNASKDKFVVITTDETGSLLPYDDSHEDADLSSFVRIHSQVIKGSSSRSEFSISINLDNQIKPKTLTKSEIVTNLTHVAVIQAQTDNSFLKAITKKDCGPGYLVVNCNRHLNVLTA